jgi:zinc protease
MAPLITPENVLAALKQELIPLDRPLIRFTGPAAPEGGEAALLAAWNEAMSAQLADDRAAGASEFGYTDFGPAGTVVSDTVEPVLGIRTVRFANGVMLNLKPTELQDDRVLVQLNLDGGNMLATRDNPLAMTLAGGLPVGGLGKHSQDDLQSLLAGRTVAMNFGADEETFGAGATTTPRDLELQLELLAALISDPGYRTEGEVQFRRNIANFFDRRDATPASALGNAREGIISDNDPRFSLQPEDDYLAANFAKLRADISDRLAHGAIELALVGDFDPDAAIAMVGRTLGALPVREAAFRPYAENRDRGFTADRTPRVIYHDGEASQALIEMTWPTRDDSDPVESAQLELLERVVTVELTDRLREELSKTYSPGAGAAQSRTYPGYGSFVIRSEIDVADVDAVRQAILETVAGLAAAPVEADVIKRARQPLLENIDNALKTNGGWMSLADRAQTEAERIERYSKSHDVVSAITAEQLQAVVKQYLDPPQRLEIVVLPRPAAD